MLFTSMFHLFYSKLKVDVHFIPIISFSSIIILLFFAGILNILFVTTFLLNSVLLVYLLHIVKTKRWNRDFLTVGFFFTAILLVVFAALFKGTILTAYDDFSHWGLMAREIIQNDQLPNFETPFLMFKSYPPGSALFLYYISKIMGYSEGILFFGQAILLLSGILPFFALVKGNKRFKYTLIIISTLFLFTVNNHLFMLSVDTLLTVLSIGAAVLLVHLYSSNELYKTPILLTPILSTIMIIKNSGILFVLISLFIYMVLSHKADTFRQLNKLKSLVLLSPFLISFLWGKHVDMVYANGLTSKHSFSVDNYRNVFGDKSIGDLKMILGGLAERMVNVSARDVKIFLAILVTFLLIHHYKRISKASTTAFSIELKLIALSLALYLVYQVSLGGMYVFSMPTNEALNLAGFRRYNMTIISYIYGMLLIHILQTPFQTNGLYSRFIYGYLIVLVSAFIFTPEINNITRFTSNRIQNEEIRSEILAAKGQQYIPANADIFLYYSDTTNISNKVDYLRYVARFDFGTRNFTLINSSSVQTVINTETDYYIIFVDQDEIYHELSSRATLDNRILYVN